MPSAVVRMVVTNAQTRAGIQANLASLRIYLGSSASPYAVPYAGVPFHVDTNTASSLILWLKLDLPAQGTVDLTAYYGPVSGAQAVHSGESVFTYFNDFNQVGDIDGWTLSDNYSGAAGQTLNGAVVHSAPTSLRNHLNAGGGGCQSNKYSYSTRTITAGQGGNHLIAFYARTSACSGCTMRHRFFLDGTQKHNITNASGAPVYKTYHQNLSAGNHSIRFGLFTNNICSGVFPAWTDDIMIGPSPNPAPSTSVGAPSIAPCAAP